MTQEEKLLLFKDLSARLPYGVICQMEDNLIINDSPFYNHTLSERHVELFRNHKGFYIKPYLRPMSSVSELISAKEWSSLGGIELIDWYNANHIDYRGLIEKGLALEAPEGMYDLKRNNYGKRINTKVS